MTDESRAARLLAEIDDVERRLDPRPLRRGRLLADLATVAVLAPVAIALDWHATRPLLLFGLMLIAIGLNHLIPHLTRRALRRERARLTGEYRSIVGADPGGEQAHGGRTP